MNSLLSYMRYQSVVRGFIFIGIVGSFAPIFPVKKKKTQTEVAVEKVKTAAFYLCVGSAGVLAAPYAVKFVKKYKKPVFQKTKELAVWAKNNPRKALVTTAVASGVVAFGMPYLAMAGTYTRDFSIAETKAWFAWTNEDKKAYVKSLKEQVKFANDLYQEVYQQYIRVSDVVGLHETGSKLQRGNSIVEQISSLQDAREDITKTVKKQVGGKLASSLDNFARLSACKSNSLMERTRNLYRQPLWMEAFSNPEEALVSYLGNEVIGDVRELFGSVSTHDKQSGLSSSAMVTMIDHLIAKYSNSKQNQEAADIETFNKAERLCELFEKLIAGVKSFKENREGRLAALELVGFSPKK